MSKPLRVLIVEDSEDDALLTIRELERGGYALTFERVETAEAMAAALKKQAWDIIISDYSMPHFSGLKALKLLQQSGLDLSFIVISGTIGEEVAVLSMKAGAHDYLMKGNLTRLMPAIERELRDTEVRRQRRQAQYDLNERVKELGCLYSIAMITERPGVTLDAVYQEVANVIPPGWQYPDITCARITIDGKEFKTPNYRETAWKQTSDIIVDGQRIGAVEVFYLEEKPEIDEGPFLKEERNLINGITNQLGSFIQRKRAEETKEHLFLMLRTIRNVNQLIVKEKNRDRLLKGICDNFTKTRGCSAAWIALLNESGGLLTAAESGLGKDFLPMVRQLKRGELPDCGQRALRQSAVVVTGESAPTCAGCSLAKAGGNKGAMTIRLEHDGKVYGLLSANLPVRFLAEPEECSLFKEVAGDIAYALHGIETEEKHKQAEEALIDSESKYRSLTENLEELIYRADPVTFEPTYANSSIERVYGYTVEEWLKDTTLWESSIHPEDKERTLAELTDAQRKVKSKAIQYRIIRKDKMMRWVEDHISWQKDSSGNVVSLSGVMRDITERKRAEEEISRRNVTSDAINRVFREAITCETEEQLTATCLAVAEELTGSKIGYIREVNEKGRLDTISMSERAWAKCNISGAREPLLRKNLKIRGIRGRVIKDEKSFISNDPMTHPDWFGIPRGHPEITSFLGVPLKQAGRTIGMLALANKEGGYDHADKDAIEILSGAIVEAWMRKRAEENIKKAAEEWRTTFDSITELVSIHDKDFRLVRVNKAFADVFKMKPEELIGKTCYPLVHGTSEPVPSCPHMKTLETKKPAAAEFFEPHLGIHLEVMTSPIFNDKGEVVASVHVARDISERKKMEEQLIATDRMASVGELAAGIAHELNNPLTSVIGFSQLLLEKDVADDVKEDIKIIYSEAQRTAGVVKGLLTFARRHAPVKQLVNINSIIEKVLELRAYEQRVSNIQVNTRFAPDLPEFMADYFQLQQVFLNIIINAEHFMIEAHNRGTLTITTERTGDIIKASFSDDGPGIAEENMGHLFDPFFTTKEIGKGTGLGLSICHGIVTEHGGRIYAEGELGKGATFIVELPINIDGEGTVK